MSLQQTPITIAIHHPNQSPIFGNNTILVTMHDEGAGSFFEVNIVNPSTPEYHRHFELEELETILKVAKQMSKSNDSIVSKEPQ